MIILITGISGYIGSELKNFFKKKRQKIYGITRKNSKSKYQNLIKNNIKPNVIIHCAGSGLVGIEKLNKKVHYKKNYNSTKDLIRFVKVSQIENCKIIFLSSQSVYAAKKQKRIFEIDKILPKSNYGKTKYLSEKILINLKKNKVIILRLFSIYGIGLKKQIIWDACEKFRKNIVKFRGDGNEVRDFLNIKDLLDLINKIIKKNYIEESTIYNVGHGRGVSINKLLNFIKKEYKSKHNITFIGNNNEAENRNFVSSNFKVEKDFKWTPSRNLFKEVKNYIGWYKKNYE